MSIDLRRRHDCEARELAADMFESGRGYRPNAKALASPPKL